jgi:hypothetical protein
MDSGVLGCRKVAGRCEYGNEPSGVPRCGGGGALHFVWYGHIGGCREYPDLHQVSPSAWVGSVRRVVSQQVQQQNNRTTQDLRLRKELKTSSIYNGT